jgi:hypothetical protein
MKLFLKISILMVLLTTWHLGLAQNSNQVIDAVNKAIQAGNAGKVASYFNNTVDLEVDDTDGNFSNKQAEAILKEFFSKKAVNSYTVKHKGSSDDGSKYIIGSYASKDGSTYRVYILLKLDDNVLKINQLQFETD